MKKSTLAIACCYLLLSAAAVYAQEPHAGHDHSPKAGKEAISQTAEKGNADKVYPLKTCVVTDLPLDSMGKPVEYTYMGHTFLLCCASCIDAIQAEPDKYIKKLTDARFYSGFERMKETGRHAQSHHQVLS